MPKIIITQDFKIRIWIYSVCFLSAFINIGGFLDYAYSLSHYTGNFVDIIYDIYIFHRITSVLILIGFSVLFMLGAAIAAFVNQNKDFHLESRFGEVQFIIGAIILLIYFCFDNEVLFVLILSMSLGVQNGLIRSYKGMGFKTTHVTGTLSDLGSYIGYYFNGDKSNSWKIVFQFMLLISFLFGTFAGIFLHHYVHHQILMYGGILYILSGLLYFILRYTDKKKNEKEAAAEVQNTPPVDIKQ